MLENPWIKKGADITKEELEKTAKKALEFTENTNVTPTLNIINDGRRVKEIKERFPVTNDDTSREDAAVRSMTEGSEDVEARKLFGDEAVKTEKYFKEKMEKLRYDLIDINTQILNEMDNGAKAGLFGFGGRSKESQEKIDNLENEYDRLETKLKDLRKVWEPQNPKKN